MTNSERILAYICEQEHGVPKDERVGVDTGAVSEALGLWRSDASAELNALVERGFLRRAGTRPVRFFLTDAQEQKAEAVEPKRAFERIIGYSGSLALQTQLARAAAMYPPFGLHTLILGGTGVGKTLMAGEMWRYIRENRGNVPKDFPFVTFNCAEYADNPQLLLSQLFGYEKGAFTGASEERPGVLDRADGGVLFLDEIHRLSSTGQEMLFTVIDKGIFRRLGGVSDHAVNVMIIGATTENPDSALLTTFRRRIPISIQIPSLRERPLKERFDLVMLFLSQEAGRVQKPIRLTRNLLKHMIAFDSEANIGDLKNEIQICCARGYLAYLADGSRDDAIKLNSNTMSRKMNLSAAREQDVEQFLAAWFTEDGVIAQPNVPLTIPGYDESENGFDFYHFIVEKLENSAAPYELDRRSGRGTELLTGQEISSREYLFSTVSPDVWAAANEITQMATLAFNQFYPRNIVNSIAFFLQQTKSFARTGCVLFDRADRQMERDYPEEKALVERVMPRLSQALGIQMTDGEKAILAFLLGQRAVAEKKPRIAVLVAAYGEHVATGVAAFVNSMLGDAVVRAVDMPEGDYAGLLSAVSDAAARYDEGQGVLLFTDINILFFSEGELAKRSGAACAVLPSVDSALVLETAKDVLVGDVELATLSVRMRAAYRQHVDELFAGTPLPVPAEDVLPQDRRSVIITYCITGTGSAKIARELLLKNSAITAAADIIPLGIMSDVASVARDLGSRLKLIVGFLNPRIPGVPFVGLESILTEDSLRGIVARLENSSAPVLGAEAPAADVALLDAKLEIVNQNLGYFTPSLERGKVAAQARRALDRILAMYPDAPVLDFAVRVYIHLITMFERLLVIEPCALTERERREIASNIGAFDHLSGILRDACRALSLPFDENEVYYLMLALPDPKTREPYFT